MDELMHHCLKELAFDGDLGCDVSRLREFIDDFYANRPSSNLQTVDDAYYSFIWSLIVQQPSVRVGTIPPGRATEVYVPLQAKAQRKAKDGSKDQMEAVVTTLELIPEAKISPLGDLIQKYGEKLRIAVDAETSFAAITGSHVRPSKLSPMVYATLQFITRTRESGISVTDLGKKTNYDQKTCFYLVKQLLQLDFIVKLRRGGNSQNFCIHKYFFERAPLWQKIRDEEARGVEESSEDPKNSLHDVNHLDESPSEFTRGLHFDPIDSRHLSSLSIIRSRIVTLLKHSENNMFAYQNIMLHIGFLNPTRTDRRFFITRMRELIAEGTIEKVLVPNANAKVANSKILCVHLVSLEGNRAENANGAVVQPQDAGDDRDDGLTIIDDPVNYGLKMNFTVHKQLINLLEDSNTTGMTLTELSTQLGAFDRRTLELLLTRLEKYPPPPHLADLGVVQVMENHGRERRHRYFTMAGYRTLVAQEGLEDPADRYVDTDLSFAGGFLAVQAADFFTTNADLVKYQDSHKKAGNYTPKAVKPRKKQQTEGPVVPAEGKKIGKQARAERSTVKAKKTEKDTKSVEPLEAVATRKNAKRKLVDINDAEGSSAAKGKLISGKGDKPSKKRSRLGEVGRGDGVFPTLPSSSNPLEDATKGDPMTSQRGRTSKGKRNTTNGNGEKDLIPTDDVISIATDNTTADVTRLTDVPGTDLPQGEKEVPARKRQGKPPKSKASAEKTVEEGVSQSATLIGVDNISLNAASIDAGDTSERLPTNHDYTAIHPDITLGLAERSADRTTEMGTGLPSVLPPSQIPLPSLDNHSLRTEATLDGNNQEEKRRSSRIRKSVIHFDGVPSTSSKPPKKRLKTNPSKDQDLLPTATLPMVPGADTLNPVPDHTSTIIFDTVSNSVVNPTVDTPSSSSVLVRPPAIVSDAVAMSSAAAMTHNSLSHSDSIQVTPDSDGIEDQKSENRLNVTTEIVKALDSNTVEVEMVHEDIRPMELVTESKDDGDSVLEGAQPDNGDSTAIRHLKKPRNKRHKTSKSKPNISQTRRENELIRVLEESGGIVNTSTKDFVEAHMTLIETMLNVGELTSAPVGSRLDRRTLETALSNLESRGRVKLITVSVMASSGGSRQAKVAYLFNLEQEKVDAFLANLGKTAYAPQPPAVRVVEHAVSYGSQSQRQAQALQVLRADRPSHQRNERWNRNFDRAEQLFAYSDEIIREILLMEQQTASQVHGFIVGKAMRARELHIATLHHLETREPSSFVVSAEHRIVNVAFYYNELSISTYCSIIAALTQDDELEWLLKAEEGRQTSVKDISPKLRAKYGIGRARSRSRILDLLGILTTLKITVPLRASVSSDPWICCSANADYPTAFDLASLDGWTNLTPQAAPQFWYFEKVAPIYLWAVSDEAPPFYKDMSIESENDSVLFWQELQKACQDKDYAQNVQCPDTGSVTGLPDRSRSGAIRGNVTWNSSYVISWHQGQYLRKFLDTSTGDTPLQDSDGGAKRLEKICHVVCAPMDIVHRFFLAARGKQLRELEKARQRSKKEGAEKNTLEKAEAKARFAKKAAEAKIQRESDWDELVRRVHPEPLSRSAASRIKALRTAYLHGVKGKETQTWLDDIAESIKEARKSDSVRKLFPNIPRKVPQRPTHPVALPPLVASNMLEKSVETLVHQQGEPIISSRETTGSKNGQKLTKEKDNTQDVASKGRVRRHRFHWTNEYDELARDASAIVRARCRYNHRMDWTALEQVFPAVPRNSVRQRIGSLKAAPGAEAYFKRLEDCWHDLWIQHRGTALLPDDEPSSPYNFNLVKHVEFLRRHVDKNAIRVGFMQQQDQSKIALPKNVTDINDDWEVAENSCTAPSWDFMWNVWADESREKYFLKEAFVLDVEPMAWNDTPTSETVRVGESVLKMTLGTPNENYDAEKASRLLYDVGEQATALATSNLLNRSVLSKLVRDPTRSVPGRTLKISEINQNALGGSIPRETFLDAAQLEELYIREQETWREWPLLSTDGDTAVMIQLASDEKVDFDFDTSHAQSTRPGLDWNSRKADDDDIEISIRVRLRGLSETPDNGTETTPQQPLLHSPSTIEMEHDDVLFHGKTEDDKVACCRQSSDGAVDCHACLTQALFSFCANLTAEDQKLASLILKIVTDAGPEGIQKERVLTAIKDKGPREHCISLIGQLSLMAIPSLFWTGYMSALVVSSKYLSAWSVNIADPDGPMTRIFPRRWLDITGRRITEVWDAALKAVIGVVLLRPAISQVEMRWRLRAVYDRQEIYDILRYLMSEGNLIRKLDPLYDSCSTGMSEIGAADDREESATLWFIGESRHWYCAL